MPKKINTKHIEDLIVTAASTNSYTVTTITESMVGYVDEIMKDHFFNTKGLLKNPTKEDNPLWANRKEKVREAIDLILNDKVTAETQRLELSIYKDGNDVVVTNFREITQEDTV